LAEEGAMLNGTIQMGGFLDAPAIPGERIGRRS
jgi:hypothetical protein